MSLLAVAHAQERQILVPNLLAKDATSKVRSEIELACEEIGINYQALEHAALKGSRAALAVIVALHFDGGAAEMMAETKPTILLRIPPEEATEVLLELPQKQRQELVAAMRERFLFWNDKTPEVEATFKQRYKRLLE